MIQAIYKGTGTEMELHWRTQGYRRCDYSYQAPRKVDQLPDEDQRALVVVLDSVVKRSRAGKLMAEI
jgi:hypothetical protein